MSGSPASSAAAGLQAVRAALGAGRSAEAEARAAELAQIHPDCGEVWLLLAMLACQAGRHEEARAAVDRALALGSASAPAHYVRARALKGAGKLEEAEHAYRDALGLDADYPEALVSLAILLRTRGERHEALPLLERAARLRPTMAEAQLHLGAALLEVGQHARAVLALEVGVRGAPDHAHAWLRLGDARAELEEWAAALRAFDRALRLDDQLAGCHHARGVALARLGRQADAVEAFRAALRIDPLARDARINLTAALIEDGAADEALSLLDTILRADPSDVKAHANRGIALRALLRHHEAADAFRHACDLAPMDADLWNHLGLAEQWLDHAEQAERCFRRALTLAPDAIAPLVNLATLWDETGRFQESAEMLRAALTRRPEHPQLLNNLGVCHVALREPAAALECFERALALDPALHTARLYAAIAQLLCGDFAPGWEQYEARWMAVPGLAATRPSVRAREWDGEPLTGKRILVYAEQGLGDALQFVRYVPMLAARGANVCLIVHASLKALFARVDGVASVHANGESLPHIDFQVAMLSLPRLLRTTLATVPASIPYLRVDQGQRETWARRLGSRDSLRVGLVWAGDPRPHDRNAAVVDRRRSIRLADFAPLWSVPGVQWHSVQKGAAAGQIRDPSISARLFDHAERLDDFSDTAALLLNLDLLISVDTSVVHLAGALGVRVWLLSRFDGCWRWLMDRDDSPWYPTLRVFRQDEPHQWGPVLERVAESLRAFAAESGFAGRELTTA